MLFNKINKRIEKIKHVLSLLRDEQLGIIKSADSLRNKLSTIKGNQTKILSSVNEIKKNQEKYMKEGEEIRKEIKNDLLAKADKLPNTTSKQSVKALINTICKD